ncbi:unnamed protein product [Wuchereria bancrofti]|uniref:Uncharacterized protein n=1 Tax=Wuchereria bancrofti TaxID=6293 RepID=A0A3P7DQU5_WUCBA|nr:unnamed protein product [Wuchereria bancrofti]
MKKKKSDTEETETTEVDSTATEGEKQRLSFQKKENIERCLVYKLDDNESVSPSLLFKIQKSVQQCCYLAELTSLALIFHRLRALLQDVIGRCVQFIKYSS